MLRNHRTTIEVNEPNQGGRRRWRVLMLIPFLLAAFAILGVKLWIEQMQRSEKHRQLLTRQSVRRIRVPAPRGRILSRDLQVLADNQVSYRVVFYPNEMRQSRRDKTVEYILEAADYVGEALGREHTLDKQKVITHINTQPGLPLVVFDDLDMQELANFYQTTGAYAGMDIETDFQRFYPNGEMAAHVIGYVRKEDASKAPDRKQYSYYLPDPVGREGVEKTFDTLEWTDMIRGLRGEAGYQVAQVDHLGYIHRMLLEEKTPVPGNNVVLTLDYRAQNIAENLLQGKRGAMVVLDADTAEVLAMASKPAPNISRYVPFLPKAYYDSLLKDPDSPLINRATQGFYAPGSIFKPLVALAILKQGISPEAIVECDGYTTFGSNTRIRCAAIHGHGPLNMYQALERSCNDYFIANGLNIGLEAEQEIFASARIGQKTGIEIPEISGVFPDREYLRRQEKRNWTAHDTGLVSIGQGKIIVTPLQAAIYTAALANGGKILRPHLLDSIRDSNGNILFEAESEVLSQLDATANSLEVVRQGMHDVVTSNTGSGHAAFTPVIDLYGKTGSAQFRQNGAMRKNTWFIAFGTYEGRTYALAVVIEDASSGGRDCAPLAAKFFEEYLKRK